MTRKTNYLILLVFLVGCIPSCNREPVEDSQDRQKKKASSNRIPSDSQKKLEVSQVTGAGKMRTASDPSRKSSSLWELRKYLPLAIGNSWTYRMTVDPDKTPLFGTIYRATYVHQGTYPSGYENIEDDRILWVENGYFSRSTTQTLKIVRSENNTFQVCIEGEHFGDGRYDLDENEQNIRWVLRESENGILVIEQIGGKRFDISVESTTPLAVFACESHLSGLEEISLYEETNLNSFLLSPLVNGLKETDFGGSINRNAKFIGRALGDIDNTDHFMQIFGHKDDFNIGQKDQLGWIVLLDKVMNKGHQKVAMQLSTAICEKAVSVPCGKFEEVCMNTFRFIGGRNFEVYKRVSLYAKGIGMIKEIQEDEKNNVLYTLELESFEVK